MEVHTKPLGSINEGLQNEPQNPFKVVKRHITEEAPFDLRLEE